MTLLHSLFLPVFFLATVALGGGWLGVSVSETDAGVAISEVVRGSPAARAGLQVDDVILAVGEDKVRDVQGLIAIIGRHNPGDRIALHIQRNREKLTKRVRLGKRPEEGEDVVEAPRGAPYLGLEIEEGDAGVQVVSVVAAGPAQKAGFQRGDLVRSMGDQPIRKLDDLDTAMKKLHANDHVRVGIRRDGRDRTLEVVLGTRPGGGEPEKKIEPARAQDRPARPAPAKPAAKVAFRTDYAKAIADSKRAGRPTLLVFGATWCVNCATLKKSLADASLAPSLAEYTCVWIDTDRESALADKYGVESLPHMVFLDAAGKSRKTMVGYQPPELIAPVLAAGLHGGAHAGAKHAEHAHAEAAAKEDAEKAHQAAKAAADKRAAEARKAEVAAAAEAQRAAAAKRVRTPVRAGRRAEAVPVTRADLNRANTQLNQLRKEIQELRKQHREEVELLRQILREMRKK
ncbi:MAG: PDZ domain-containing protein [Planctomycetes bacterium]|nr:PDZ domain-containing protein [Planctomycetota bacterium]MCB9871179.1 PDZ domain-containing protein [Planctomycetota bacterium]